MENESLSQESSEASTQTPDGGSLMSTSETQTEGDWKQSLPEDLRSNPTIANVKSVGDLANMLVHAQSLVGKDKVILPSKDAPEDEWGKVWDRLGRPESPDKYGVDDEEFASLAHKLGLTERQVKGIQEKIKEKAAYKPQYDAESALSELRKEFGDQTEPAVELARQGLSHFGGEELAKYLDESGLGNDPRLVKAFFKIGKAVQEDKLYGAGSLQPRMIVGKESAKSEINRLKADKDFMAAYTDRGHPQHEEFFDKFKELHEIAFSE